MTSILYSNSCLIEEKQYHVDICLKQGENEQCQSNDAENLLLKNDNFQLKQNENWIFIRFNLLNKEEKDDQTICPSLVLNKIIFIQQNEKTSKQLIEIEINYVQISESFLWNVQQMKIQMNSTSANEFCTLINEYLLKIADRPRNLLVFVNPNSGKNNANEMYNEEVLPLFEKSNIKVKTIVTEHENHAQDYLKDNCFDEYDGIICVGGDGFFSQISSSILLKTIEKFHLNINDENIELIRPSIRVGIIPCGSTDSLVFSTTGHNNPITSALQILTGQSIFIDIATVS